MKMFDPFKVDISEETLMQIARRVAMETNVGVGAIRSATKGVETGSRNDPIKLKVIEARERFAYEAYKSGRYSLTTLAKWCGFRRDDGRHTIRKRIHTYAAKKNIPVPRFNSTQRTNLASRKVEFARSDFADNYS